MPRYLDVQAPEHGVQLITLQRPEALNALCTELLAELAAALQLAGGDEQIRAVVITGSTKAFAAGGTFSNSIVNSPTAFRFSSGGSFKPGVMGEDGPEAIIPLARGRDGKLGIASQGSGQPINITVHVNGNSTAPDVRRSAEQGAREGLSVLNGARRYG